MINHVVSNTYNVWMGGKQQFDTVGPASPASIGHGTMGERRHAPSGRKSHNKEDYGPAREITYSELGQAMSFLPKA
jgi:hypothetical protein